jgi:hypothetical protein
MVGIRRNGGKHVEILPFKKWSLRWSITSCVLRQNITCYQLLPAVVIFITLLFLSLPIFYTRYLAINGLTEVQPWQGHKTWSISVLSTSFYDLPCLYLWRSIEWIKADVGLQWCKQPYRSSAPCCGDYTERTLFMLCSVFVCDASNTSAINHYSTATMGVRGFKAGGPLYTRSIHIIWTLWETRKRIQVHDECIICLEMDEWIKREINNKCTQHLTE